MNFIILSLFASPQFCDYFTSTMSNVRRFSRAPRKLTGGFNYSWLTGKKNTRSYTDDLTCTSNRAMTTAAWTTFSCTRAREIETVSREIPIGIHTYGGRIFSFFRPTHLLPRWFSSLKAAPLSRSENIARRLAFLRLVLFTFLTLNASDFEIYLLL